MVVFPVVAALVSGVFAVLLVQRWRTRKAPAELFWGVSLAMFTVASLAVAAGVGGGWNDSLFRVYWAFGAILNVPFLALGSIALFRNRIATGVGALVVAALSLYVLGVTFTAKTQANAFVQHQKPARDDCPNAPVVPLTPRYDIPRGKCVWQPHSSVGKLASTVSIPSYLIVVLVAAVTTRRRAPQLRNRRIGTWLVAAGATIVAVGGTAIARLGRGVPFSISLALGVTVMFVGFVLATRPAQREPQAEATS